ncbi:MAG: lactate utilization protein [Euryarchaeota archaeon]|nr:lactate utilization protein [Euryarchaeota archaeon]
MFQDVHKKIIISLEDEDLRNGSREATREEMKNRLDAIKRHPYAEDWAKEIKEIKRKLLLDPIKNFEDFKKSFEGEGKYIYFAKDGEEAKKIILKIIGKKSTVVKSKSLVGEEIELRQFLEMNGINVYETDLGEFLVQLVNGKPAHMVTPAVNMTEGRARNVLYPVIKERMDDVVSMVLGVRGFMREKFLSADVGITGANALSIDTGSIVFITNEGNGALSSTLPEKLVVITSIEKIYPSIKDAIKASIVQTVYAGFKNTTYIHIINGVPKEPKNGPKELHLIIVDNGRTGDISLKETLYCIKCGSCQLSCPIFREVDGAWGEIYTAAIGIPWTAITGKISVARDLSYFCLQCGRCKEVCPMKIDIPNLILKIKRERF